MRTCLSSLLSGAATIVFVFTALVHIVAWLNGQWLVDTFFLSWISGAGAGLLFLLATLFEVARSRTFILTIWPRHFFASMPWGGRVAVFLVWMYALASMIGYINALGTGKIPSGINDPSAARVLSGFVLPFSLSTAMYFRYALVRSWNSAS